MSVEEFLAQVAWPGVQPSPSGGGEASATQEPEPVEDDVPPESFIIETDPVPREEVAAQEPSSPIPVSPAPVIDDSHPSALALKPEQPIVQDPPAAPVLDLNEHAEDHPQED